MSLFRAAALLLSALLLSCDPSEARLSLVGGMRPVAAERSARAVWVNPAAVGVTGRASAVLEVILEEDFSFLGSGDPEEWGFPRDLQGISAAAGTDRLAYGLQLDSSGEPGAPEWTFAVANRVGMGKRGHLGATMEWRQGDGVEASAGALLPLGRSIRLAAVVHDLLQRDLGGESVSRHWRLGAATPFRSQHLTLSYDAVLADSVDPVHWLALSLDGWRHARALAARSSEGDWSVELGASFPRHSVGLGAMDRERPGTRRPQRAFAWAEWRDQAER